MAGRPQPPQISSVVEALRQEAARQKFTGYSLTKATGLPLRTVQRVLGGSGSPTITTLECIASALGLTVTVVASDRRRKP